MKKQKLTNECTLAKPGNLQPALIKEVIDSIVVIRETSVLIDRDVAAIYGVATRDINKAVKNNPRKFPTGYYFELDAEEKRELVENFHRFDSLKHSTVMPKAFSEKGLYMLATILKSDIATEASFDFAKPIGLISYLAKICFVNSDDVVLDFFSGSATTAHAVMQLNAEDGGKRKFIMVQLPEETDEKSEAYKAGYMNICEIGKERIRRAGKKIKEESPLTTQDLDTGFRVLKHDSSNMQDVYYTPAEFNEQKLFDDNIKPDRTEEDLLFQSMIDLGIELSAKIEKRSIAGKTVWSVSDGYLMACFDEEVNESAITEIARQQPYYFVMRDSNLANDQVADNFEQIWEEYSKDTVRRIL